MTEDRQHRPPDVTAVPQLPADFRAFHELYRPIYVRWAEPFLGSRADAEEAVDQTFEQLYVRWATVLQQDSPNAYAWKVLKNRCIDLARARRRRPTVIDFAAFETQDLRTAVDPIGELEDTLSLYQEIDKLPERQHDAIVLTCAHGLDSKSAAQVMGITEAGVRSTVRYAKHRLMQALSAAEEAGDHE